MADKTSLTVKDKFSEKRGIVAIRDSAVSYIDDQFFKHRFFELDPDEKGHSRIKELLHIDDLHEEKSAYTTYPVSVKAVRIDWLLRDDAEEGESDTSGYKFLTALYHCENLQLFKEPSIILIIEYFYQKFRDMIQKTFMTFNVI